MSTKAIEQELAEVKKRISAMESQFARKPSDAWREIVGTSFRREIHEAAKFFRRLIPFLPTEERP